MGGRESILMVAEKTFDMVIVEGKQTIFKEVKSLYREGEQTILMVVKTFDMAIVEGKQTIFAVVKSFYWEGEKKGKEYVQTVIDMRTFIVM